MTGRALSRLAFADVDRASTLLGPHHLGLCDARREPTDDGALAIVERLAGVGDADLALLSLCRVVDALRETGRTAADELLAALRAEPDLRDRLLAVLGASSALGDWLAANPAEWPLLRGGTDQETLRRGILLSVGADPDDPVLGTAGSPARVTGGQAVRELRLAYRRAVTDLAARDLTGELTLDRVADELSDLAATTLQAGLAVAAAELPAAAPAARLSVIGLGKCGGYELNYVSDVDVVFVASTDPDHPDVPEDQLLRTATTLATTMMRVCTDVAWPVDAGLRPEGKVGQLVRTLASHEAYYRRWARTWEFQALLKARPVAGDLDLGRAYVDALSPLVWSAAERENFVDDVQAMRRRVEDHVPARVGDRELKLGRGGLRDVEFAVQLLQLVHGRADESLRAAATLVALAALAEGGYVGLEDGAALGRSYRFLRTVEHRLMLQRLRRTHTFPDDADELRWLARTMGYRGGRSGDAVAELRADRAAHARDVRRLHEKLFYRPLLRAVAKVPGEALRLTPEAAMRRLKALGFARPEGALRHIEALTGGVSRTAAMQRLLLPAMLESFADSADPDAGLLAYRQVSEQLGSTPWYLRLLRDEGAVAQRLAHVLGSSRYVADLLSRAPEAMRLLADLEQLAPRPPQSLRTAFRRAAARQPGPQTAVATVRALRRYELLRISCADLLELQAVDQVGTALSAVADATVRAALDVAIRKVLGDKEDLPTRVAVIAMGRWGGGELGYGSDADVLFVHRPLPGADEAAASDVATAVAEELTSLLAAPAVDPPFLIDANLRPEGRNGPLVRTLASYREYYERWASVWEAQALLRARPVAGDPEVGERFVELIDAVRYPGEGIAEDDVREIRRIKARVDSERLPRGADPATHTKLGRGGLTDVEWTIQLLQLRHAGRIPELRTPSTLDALAAARAAGLLDADDAAALEAAWLLATRCRNAIMLVRARAGDQLPRGGRELSALAAVLGYPPGRDPGQFLDDYRRVTRRARAVVERVFYG